MPSSFTPLLTTALPSTITCAAWCPTMDLLALGSDDGKLAVRRLNWQRLWAAPVESSVETASTASAPSTTRGPACVAWRPDGRALACPAPGGGVEIRAAEDGRVLTTTAGRRVGDRPRLTALAWTAERPGLPPPPGSLVGEGPPARECPCMPPVFGEGGSGANAAPPAAAGTTTATSTTTHRPRRAPTPAEPPRLDVLAAADAGGGITLYGPGLLRLAVIEGGGPVAGVALSDDLATLWALRSSPASTLALAALHTGPLSSLRPEVRRAAHLLGRLADAVADADAGLSAAAKAWAGAGGSAAGKVLSGLARLQADYGTGGPSTTPGAAGTPGGAAAELRRAMLCGCGGGGGGAESDGSGALAALLERSPWGEAGLKRAAREADAAAAAAAAALVNAAEPALEAAAFWAGELGCLSACERWSAPLGLDAPAVSRVAALARDAAVAAAAARRAVVDGGAAGRAFFVWLLLAAGARSGGGGGGGAPAPAEAAPAEAARAAAALDALLSDAAGAALAEGPRETGPATPDGGEGGGGARAALPQAVWAALGGRAAPPGAPVRAVTASLAAEVEGLADRVAAALSAGVKPAGPAVEVGGEGPGGGGCGPAVAAAEGGGGVAAAFPAGGPALAHVSSPGPGGPLTTAHTPLPAPPAALALYRGGAVAALLPGRGGGGSGVELGLLDPSSHSPSSWECARTRSLPSSLAPGDALPVRLAVSGPRGVAVVFGGGGSGGGGGGVRTATLLDLEEDEEEEEAGDEGGDPCDE